ETVFLCCRKLGLKEQEAEDVASETFLAAYKSIGRYRGGAELSTWLWSIAYRQAASFLRKQRRHLQKDKFTAETAEGAEKDNNSKISAFSAFSAVNPSAAAQSKETGKIVWEAVGRLPRLWAMAVILYYREEKSISDIAEIMCAKDNTVKTYLYRARERLKGTLAPTFGEDSDACE
ncbi:MAG: RNA polymerase sigma factor, partial [Planctomycetota bacterium]